MESWQNWINNHSLVVWISVIPAITTLLGILFRAKKSDKPKLSDRLTVFGVMLVVFTIVGVYFNLRQQYSDYKANLHEKRTDSTIQSERFSAILSNLQRQRTEDSTKIVTDSLRYRLLMSQIEQELIKQGETFKNINSILHPIFPLRVNLSISIDLKNGHLSDIDQLFAKAADDTLKKARAFNPRVSSVSIGCKFSIFQEAQNNSLIESCKKVFPRSMRFNIASESSSGIKKEESVFDFGITEQQYIFRYSYDQQSHRLFIQIYSDILEPLPLPTIKSFSDIKSASIKIQFGKTKAVSDYRIDQLTFRCGSSFQDIYSIKIDETMREKPLNWFGVRYYNSKLK